MPPNLKAALDRFAAQTGHRSVDQILAAQHRRNTRASLRVVAENPKETKPFWWGPTSPSIWGMGRTVTPGGSPWR